MHDNLALTNLRIGLHQERIHELAPPKPRRPKPRWRRSGRGVDRP